MYYFLPICQAVKKSRVKSKQKTQETQDRVQVLKGNIVKLEEKIDSHRKTLKLLKELFLAQAKSKSDTMTSEAVKLLLKDDEDDEEDTTEAPTTSRSTTSSARSKR